MVQILEKELFILIHFHQGFVQFCDVAEVMIIHKMI
jgi:hypothetical protein